MYPIKLYIIVCFDINPHIFMVSHQEHSFAPKGCGFAVRSSLFCCCSINRCSRSLLLCSRNTLVGSLKSSIASTSQPALFSSHSTNSFQTNKKNISLEVTVVLQVRFQIQAYRRNRIHGREFCSVMRRTVRMLILYQNLCLSSDFWSHILYKIQK